MAPWSLARKQSAPVIHTPPPRTQHTGAAVLGRRAPRTERRRQQGNFWPYLSFCGFHRRCWRSLPSWPPVARSLVGAVR